MTHILIVTSRYYPEIADELVGGAVETVEKSGASFEEITVPGAFEIPSAIALALETNAYDGFIALGCVVRGETSHYDYVCGESARGLMDLSLSGIPIGYGILTVETMEQAQVRADRKNGGKGEDAANACLRMIELKRKFDVAQ